MSASKIPVLAFITVVVLVSLIEMEIYYLSVYLLAFSEKLLAINEEPYTMSYEPIIQPAIIQSIRKFTKEKLTVNIFYKAIILQPVYEKI
jgi:hypothetical protein